MAVTAAAAQDANALSFCGRERGGWDVSLCTRGSPGEQQEMLSPMISDGLAQPWLKTQHFYCSNLLYQPGVIWAPQMPPQNYPLVG